MLEESLVLSNINYAATIGIRSGQEAKAEQIPKSAAPENIECIQTLHSVQFRLLKKLFIKIGQ